ncbi:MAG TPA: hypothetical protein VHK89_06380 [Actinomycetota bacterium]|nr:hypothetical protein [Actinomycetota bacterium]
MSSRKAAKFVALLLPLGLACGPASEGAPAAGGSASTVRLTVRTAGEGPMYVEGALHYVAIRSGGEVVFRGRLRGGEVTREVESGSVRVAHWARPCVANCALDLDPPTDRCSARLEVVEDTTAVIRLRAVGGCAISPGG